MHVEPSPSPTVVRKQAQTRAGSVGQYCRVCSEPVVEICAGCSKPVCRVHLGAIIKKVHGVCLGQTARATRRSRERGGGHSARMDLPVTMATPKSRHRVIRMCRKTIDRNEE
eukprot:2196772-Pyramimonas_sp.AAC.1